MLSTITAMHLDADEQGAAVVDESDREGEVTELLAQIEHAMSHRQPCTVALL